MSTADEIRSLEKHRPIPGLREIFARLAEEYPDFGPRFDGDPHYTSFGTLGKQVSASLNVHLGRAVLEPAQGASWVARGVGRLVERNPRSVWVNFTEKDSPSQVYEMLKEAIELGFHRPRQPLKR